MAHFSYDLVPTNLNYLKLPVFRIITVTLDPPSPQRSSNTPLNLWFPFTYLATPYCETQMDDEATLSLAGKSYGLRFSSWRKFQDILDTGRKATTAANPNFLSEWYVFHTPSTTTKSDSFNRERQMKDEYQNLLSVEPKVPDILTRVTLLKAAKILRDGREAFRSSQAHTISTTISLWSTGYAINPNKIYRGLMDDTCGRLLCPPEHNWDDPT